MRTQKSQTRAQATSSCQCLPRFSLCSRKKKEGLIQGKLRIRSVPGTFLVLGMMVVIVGTTLAVVGYWPYRVQQSAVGSVSNSLSSPSQATSWSLGAKGLFSTASLIHSDRMKLLGPVIMGVGLFILICANTMLYENRDRETQMLLSQTQSLICTVSATVPSADLTLIRHYQWVSSLPAAYLNILSPKELAFSEPLLQAKNTEEERVSHQKRVLCIEVLHHQESFSASFIHSSDSCNSTKGDFRTYPDAKKGASGGQQPQPESHSNLSKYLTSSFMSPLEGEDWELTMVSPKRSHSMSYITSQHSLSRPLVRLEERAGQYMGCFKQLPQRCSSEVCVNLSGIGTETLDLSPVACQKHNSWP